MNTGCHLMTHRANYYISVRISKKCSILNQEFLKISSSPNQMSTVTVIWLYTTVLDLPVVGVNQIFVIVRNSKCLHHVITGNEHASRTVKWYFNIRTFHEWNLHHDTWTSWWVSVLEPSETADLSLFSADLDNTVQKTTLSNFQQFSFI